MKSALIKAGSIFVTVFLAIYGFLDPLGGFEFLTPHVSVRGLLYACLALVSTLVALISAALFWKRDGSDSGIIETGLSRSGFDQLAFLRSASRCIKAIGLSLPVLATETGLNVLESLLNNRYGTVEVVICDPASSAIPLRPEEIYPHGKQPTTSVKETIKTLSTFRSRLGVRAKSHFHLYVATHPFGIGMLQADDKILWSPILANRSGATAPFQICSAQSEFGKILLEHFETLRTRFSTLEWSIK